jgi:hypothetical protein
MIVTSRKDRTLNELGIMLCCIMLITVRRILFLFKITVFQFVCTTFYKTVCFEFSIGHLPGARTASGCMLAMHCSLKEGQITQWNRIILEQFISLS